MFMTTMLKSSLCGIIYLLLFAKETVTITEAAANAAASQVHERNKLKSQTKSWNKIEKSSNIAQDQTGVISTFGHFLTTTAKLNFWK